MSSRSRRSRAPKITKPMPSTIRGDPVKVIDRSVERVMKTPSVAGPNCELTHHDEPADRESWRRSVGWTARAIAVGAVCPIAEIVIRDGVHLSHDWDRLH